MQRTGRKRPLLSAKQRPEGAALFYQPSVGPDGSDVVTMEHVDGPLKALPHRQLADRLREVAVIHHDGVKELAHSEALAAAEVPVAGGGAQVVALRHRQEILGPVGFHACA